MVFKDQKFLILRFVLVTILVVGMFGPTPARALSIVYRVTPGGAISGSCGADWLTPCDLQYALTTLASTGDEIWVSAGTYKPTQTADRSISFVLKNGVAVYGGFAGSELARDGRDVAANLSILSGDIGISGDNTDNSYHVVAGSGTDSSALLDGFTITGGYANGPLITQWSGGGLYNDHGSPTLVNLTFNANWADESGGGVFNYYSNPTLTNVTFTGNSATDFGGGMNNSNSNPTLTNVVFSGNVGTDFGGGMSNFRSNAILTDVTFSDNAADNWGGGLHNNTSTPSLTNVTFNGNSAPSGGGMYNHTAGNPILTNVTFNNNSATFGGGLYNFTSSQPDIRNTTFSYNTANSGGAIYNYQGTPILNEVQFIRNTVSASGGAIYSQQSPGWSLTNVSFIENSANRGRGGGMFNYANSPTLTSVTFSGNIALDGGAIYNHTGSSPTLTNVTFAGNDASYTGTAMVNFSNSNPILTNAILWDDTLPAIGEIYNSNSTPVISYSIVQGSGGSAAWNPALGIDKGNNLDANPLLAPLNDNGGFTLTAALGTGSPAIDTGDNAACPATDQRGVTRPQGSGCDIGAYEFAQYAISGNTTVGAVTLSYPEGTIISDENGNYSLTVPYDWSGSITASKPGYRFTPESRTYENVQADQLEQDFLAERVYTISGNAGVAGATLSYEENGILKTVTSSSNGEYSLQVPENWTGTVTPAKANVIFTPANRSYTSMQADLSGENYTTTITVVNQNNAGTGSLRQAILDATSGATINFAPSLSGKTILLASEIAIDKSLIVDGSGLSPRVEISGGDAVKIFAIGWGYGVDNLNIVLRSLVLRNAKGLGTSYSNTGAAILMDFLNTLTIENVSFVGNSSKGPGAAINSAGTLTVLNSDFISNSSQDSGGAISISATGRLTIKNSRFVNNTAASAGGAITFSSGWEFTVEDTTFENNVANTAGAIAIVNSAGTVVTFRNNLFSGNRATGSSYAGGAIRSVYDDTRAPNMLIENNTFFNNQSAGFGGAISTEKGILLKNNTFSHNQASISGASLHIAGSTNTSINLYNNIFANNTGGGECVTVFSNFNTHGNNNLVEDGSSACLPAIVNDPMLGSLADNGGSTQTMALLAGSPAINAGDNSNCPAMDQRGVSRPQGGTCDLGAYEYVPPPPPTYTPTLTATPPYSYNPLYLSLASGQTLGGVSSSDEDILRFDGTNWSMFFDGSDVGVSSPDLFAFSLLDADTLLMAFSSSVTVNGISATPQDVLRFDATSLGSTTSGTWSLYFDGSDVGLSTSSENIDSLTLLSDGRLLISTTGDASVTGLATARDEDVLAFTATSLGNTTSGTWSLYFDGSDVGLADSNNEDIDALDVTSNGKVYLSTLGDFTVPGVSGADEDVFVCTPTSIGDSTICNYSPTLYFDGSTWGLSGNDVDAFNFHTLGPLPTPVPSNTVTPSQTATRTRTPTATFTATASATPTLTRTPTSFPTSPTAMWVHVLQPNGGEVLNVGSVYRITWNSTPDIDKVTIGYKACESCLDWIATNIPNTGYYDWTVFVGNTTNTQFKIYIIAYDTGVGSTSDVSDSNFTVPQPTPTATYTRTPTATPSQTPTPSVTASPSTLTFTAVADAYVNSGSPTTNYGSSTTLRTDADPDLHSYLRFSVQGLNGTVTKATLRVFANSSSSLGCTANSVGNTTWTESTVNYSNAPVVGGALGSSGSFGALVWVNIDVTAYVTGNGTYNFALTTPSSTAISFASREMGTNAPQLVIETVP